MPGSGQASVFSLTVDSDTSPQVPAPAKCFERAPCFRSWLYNSGMEHSRRLTAIIEREADGYVALCPELDIASQGDTVEQARANLIEALTLFFETATSSEIERRLHTDVFVTQVEVPIG